MEDWSISIEFCLIIYRSNMSRQDNNFKLYTSMETLHHCPLVTQVHLCILNTICCLIILHRLDLFNTIVKNLCWGIVYALFKVGVLKLAYCFVILIEVITYIYTLPLHLVYLWIYLHISKDRYSILLIFSALYQNASYFLVYMYLFGCNLSYVEILPVPVLSLDSR